MITKLNDIQNSAELIKVHKFITDNRLIIKHDKVLVALSGGADSVALMLILVLLKDEYELSVEAFHLNHGIRKNAINDENFCVKLCEEFNVTLHVFHSDIPKIAKKNKVSEETAGRMERYRIIDELSKDFTKVATAHHADDNAETVLMHIIRGSGVSGICGIPLSREKIIRPLLCLTKEEIYNFVNRAAVEYAVDETNFENEYFRNRVRNILIPQIKEECPNFSQNVFNLSQVASDYCDLAMSEADKIDIKKEDNTYIVSYCDIESLHRVVLYSLISKIGQLCEVYENIGYNSVNSLIALIKNKENTTWEYSLYSMKVKRVYGKVIFVNNRYFVNDEILPYEYKIGLDGVYVFAKQGFALKISSVQKIKKNVSNEIITYIDYDKIDNSAIIRSRKAGDSYNQIGLGHKKTVKKLFIDRKVPESKRNRIPILCINGEIAAIIGFETDENFKVTDQTKNIMKIEYINLN